MNDIDLSTLVKSPEINTISGRTLGEEFSEKTHFLESMKRNEKVVIIVDDQKIKAINDSFIKGFFSAAFNLLKTKKNIENLVEIKANNYYKALFEKNWQILESINS